MNVLNVVNVPLDKLPLILEDRHAYLVTNYVSIEILY